MLDAAILWRNERERALPLPPLLDAFDLKLRASLAQLDDEAQGLIEAPFHFSFIMGVLGGIPATAKHLGFQASNVPAGSRWKVIGISRDQWPLCMAALALGGDIRVGLEDNFYLPDGAMARNNGDLVDAAAKMVRLSGREVSTVEETRAALWPSGGGNF